MSSGVPTAPAACPWPAVIRRSEFPGSAGYVAQVRQWLREALGDCPVVEDAVLLASELVAGHEIGDMALFEEAAQDYIDGTVKLLKSLKSPKQA